MSMYCIDQKYLLYWDFPDVHWCTNSNELSRTCDTPAWISLSSLVLKTKQQHVSLYLAMYTLSYKSPKLNMVEFESASTPLNEINVSSFVKGDNNPCAAESGPHDQHNNNTYAARQCMPHCSTHQCGPPLRSHIFRAPNCCPKPQLSAHTNNRLITIRQLIMHGCTPADKIATVPCARFRLVAVQKLSRTACNTKGSINKMSLWLANMSYPPVLPQLVNCLGSSNQTSQLSTSQEQLLVLCRPLNQCHCCKG